ncbi:unnamed protein product [Tetraodon nigroviridis]|uniref:(spotted green pufferfish) hypothetical protein n=1 Tax=Tetraodon nigroviridis TaxID=99883 RepID=Q4SUQ6_TETNG|nr:unnamed protein product [Tetraodon nigroviridis]
MLEPVSEMVPVSGPNPVVEAAPYPDSATGPVLVKPEPVEPVPESVLAALPVVEPVPLLEPEAQSDPETAGPEPVNQSGPGPQPGHHSGSEPEPEPETDAEVKFTPGKKQSKFEVLMTQEELEEEQRAPE